MNPFFNPMAMPGVAKANPMQNIMNVMQQVRQIKQNPSQLASLLQQRGMVNESQAKEIEKMGNNYEQIGHYLMNNGKLPNNVQPFQGQIEQVQNLMNQEQ